MAKEKIKNSIWFVIFDGLKIYFSNIDKFILFMLFPVFGQIIGLALAFGMTIGLADRVAEKAPNMNSALGIIFLLALPGLLIFLKAFWDYMVAYVALNSMTEGAITTGKVYDFQSHREVATRRVFKYIGLLLAIGILSFLGILSSLILLGLVPTIIFLVFFILVYQVFTFEDDLSVKEYFKKIFYLVKGDWLRTFFLILILWFFSIYIITEGVSVVFDCLHLTDKICSLLDFIGNNIPILEEVNKALKYFGLNIITVNVISKFIFMSILCTIITGLSLPIRSICCTLWYKTLSSVKETNSEQKTKKQKKNKKDNENDE